ncbi:MAG: hypothetical protein AABW50_02010 [Nanoarchaeota archaeon]
MAQKFIEYLLEAQKITKSADHLFYITFPLIKDKRLLMKILTESKKAIICCINSILQYEYLQKSIKLEKDSVANFKIFREKCAEKYSVNSEEIALIIEIFNLMEKHKKSTHEILKDNKIIILSGEMNQDSVSLEKTKSFLNLTKSLLAKTKNGFKNLRKI